MEPFQLPGSHPNDSGDSVDTERESFCSMPSKNLCGLVSGSV
jgi:hypothetical protein